MMILEQKNLLEDGEVVLMTIRKHWIVYAYDLLTHIVGALFAIGATFFLAEKGFLGGLYKTEVALGSIVLVGFLLIVWTSFFYVWTKQYFDVWYLTDRRLVAINQRQIFERDEASMELGRVQDISFEKKGILGNVFNFGKVTVQSAGTHREFIMHSVANVEDVVKKITELRDDIHPWK